MFKTLGLKKTHHEMSFKCSHYGTFYIYSKDLTDEFRENVCFIVIRRK